MRKDLFEYFEFFQSFHFCTLSKIQIPGNPTLGDMELNFGQNFFARPIVQTGSAGQVQSGRPRVKADGLSIRGGNVRWMKANGPKRHKTDGPDLGP